MPHATLEASVSSMFTHSLINDKSNQLVTSINIGGTSGYTNTIQDYWNSDNTKLAVKQHRSIQLEECETNTHKYAQFIKWVMLIRLLNSFVNLFENQDFRLLSR